jgi:hypothetical protein
MPALLRPRGNVRRPFERDMLQHVQVHTTLQFKTTQLKK